MSFDQCLSDEHMLYSNFVNNWTKFYGSTSDYAVTLFSNLYSNFSNLYSNLCSNLFTRFTSLREFVANNPHTVLLLVILVLVVILVLLAIFVLFKSRETEHVVENHQGVRRTLPNGYRLMWCSDNLCRRQAMYGPSRGDVGVVCNEHVGGRPFVKVFGCEIDECRRTLVRGTIRCREHTV